MRGPQGKEFSGWWLVAAVIAMAFLLGLLPHAPDMQYTGAPSHTAAGQ